MDYQTVIVVGFVALIAGIAAMVFAVRAVNGVCIVFCVLALISSLWSVIVGFQAMDEYQRILDGVLNG
ncbi:hypothetical protein FPZ12_028110 [Amycolatopsis acidicola]|uniref:Uncharacterized protein n=1 Tax=Amycolatopsis acidicola TaxID=2596893 RepID=A0A5N0UUC3_9PSEU|nr:DUF308 domain-containing protein [Amycolatopsis acidicola]KAA9156194.1 hypothetical protein FPZ12_028110 [Amycolatopsis acidicola]